MVLNARLVLCLASLILFLVPGCVWLDEEPPTGHRIVPELPVSRRAPPEVLDSLPGMDFVAHEALSAFMGAPAFRLVLAVQSRLPRNDMRLIVLESDSGGTPRWSGYPMQGAAGGSYGVHLSGFDFSPDGSAVAYLAESPTQGLSRPTTPWMQTLGSNPWLVPLASGANASGGMIGQGAFWHFQDGKPAIGFTGLAYGSGFPQRLQVADTRFVVPLGDDAVSPVDVFRIGGRPIEEEILAITRDGSWTLIAKDSGTRLWPAEWLLDPVRLTHTDTLRRMTAGSGADLNPFDPSETDHMDYYATLPFMIPEAGKPVVPDTALTPHFLDGTSGLSAGPNTIWICDRDRHIILSHPLPEGRSGMARWVRWTEHPNFLLTSTGGSLYLVRLGPDSRTLLAGTEMRTLNADGILKLATDGSAIVDAGLWIGE